MVNSLIFYETVSFAGLWGIFWYKEIRGKKTITFWLSSALATVLGILLLSQEHLHGSG
jgi:hypothetical protein